MAAPTPSSPVPLEPQSVIALAFGLKQASQPGKSRDGALIHLHYRRIDPSAPPTGVQEAQAAHADSLGLPRDRYTGRVDRVYRSGSGDVILTLFVELERDHQFRSFNLSRGQVFQLVELEQ